MLNFPVPYSDELLYSTVARAGVHFGITSPKILLDEVFGDRNIVATVDLPTHIQAISDQYPKSLGLTAETLTYKHTLFPLYAPFVPEARRLKCLDQMIRWTKGAVHLALGVTASLVRQKQHFRICPECMDEQIARHGEHFWVRQWHAPGCEYCLAHEGLSSVRFEIRNSHRHSFIALAPTIACLPPRSNSPPYDKRIENRVNGLLALPPAPSPSLEQWSLFYKHLAHDAILTRKSKVIFDNLKDKVLASWSPQKLHELGIPISDSQTNWLRLSMRKHRKAFSYLQHIVMLEALLGPNWSFEEVISQVRKQNAPKTTAPFFAPTTPSHVFQTKRLEWLKLVKTMGTRKARLFGWGYLYTWLYRNDRSWLREINQRHKKTTRSENRRVNWHERDKLLLEKLEAIQLAHIGIQDW